LKNNNLFIWINQSNGDTLGIIPVLELLFATYPDVKVRFACYEDQAYLVEHLPLEVFPIKGNYKYIPERETFFNKIDPSIYDNFTTIHLWGGLYKYEHKWIDQVKTFNNQCKEKNIDFYLNENSDGFIELPEYLVDVKNRAVYVENGYTVSGHSNFSFDMYKLSIMFPRINFYTTYSSNYKASNIVDCSNMNLIQLANVSKKCELIVGKGSGPFMCTFSKANKDKPKYLLGFIYSHALWNKYDTTKLLYHDQELYESLRQINKSK
jgi:hypothetical protein